MTLDDLKLILVPTDFSEASTAALRAAIRLARAFQASIEVFHVDPDPAVLLPPPLDVVSRPAAFERVLAETADKLERVVAEVREAGVPCTSASELGRSDTSIIEQARRTGAGLIVMGTHGRHGLSHALIGSVAEKVVEHGTCPVLVVPVGGRA
jgi:nucleotide-binding universal stress UspA family protein